MNAFLTLLCLLGQSYIVKLVIWGIVADTVFGVGRAIRQHKFNSSFGINGAIRKVAMLACMVLLIILDYACGINIFGLLPDRWREVFEFLEMAKVGLAEFFGLLFIMYEAVSVLKNMYFCGLPVRWVWLKVNTFLIKYTDELPDTEGIENDTNITNQTDGDSTE